MLPQQPSNLRQCGMTELRVTLPASSAPRGLRGIQLVNRRTGQSVVLASSEFDPESRELRVLVSAWEKSFSYDSDYELRLPASLTGAAQTIRLHTELPPYRLAWSETRLPGGAAAEATATVTNLGAAIPAGAVLLQVVCDQVRGGEQQTVYFGSRQEAFAAGETRQVRLPLQLEQDFHSRPWAGVGYTECRNEYVEGLGQRRAGWQR